MLRDDMRACAQASLLMGSKLTQLPCRVERGTDVEIVGLADKGTVLVSNYYYSVVQPTVRG